MLLVIVISSGKTKDTSMISRETYKRKSRRIRLLLTIGILLISILAYMVLPFDHSGRAFLSPLVGMLNSIRPSWLGTTMVVLLYILVPLSLIVGFAFILDRRWGVKCPSCKYSLTLRSSPETVLFRNKCPACGEELWCAD